MKLVWSAAIGLAFLAACGPQPAAEQAAQSTAPAPALTAITLPASLEFPEGVAFDPAARVFYTAGAADGAVHRIGLDGVSTIVAAPGALVPVGNKVFPGPLGMKFDNGRLFVAGGSTGKMWVVDTASGKVLKTYSTPASPAGLINDVAIADGHAYFTDTLRPTLWRAASGATLGALEPWLDLKGTPIEYADGPNLNGIAATPDGKSLFVVQMNKGLLFKIDIATKKVTPVDLKGQTAEGADGVILNGQTAYIVRQTANEIVTVALNPEMNAGDVVKRFQDPALAWPATAVLVDDRLYVVNTQFNTRDNGTTRKPFTISGVPVAVLSPN
jgi:Cu-Zn family superoxide dismutase